MQTPELRRWWVYAFTGGLRALSKSLPAGGKMEKLDAEICAKYVTEPDRLAVHGHIILFGIARYTIAEGRETEMPSRYITALLKKLAKEPGNSVMDYLPDSAVGADWREGPILRWRGSAAGLDGEVLYENRHRHGHWGRSF
jgi:hypothetical protein